MNLVKSATLAAAFIVGAGVASAANAADVYERGGSYKDAPSYAPAFGWTGFYIGAHVGSTFEDTLTIDAGGIELEGEVEETALAGLHLGYNWQTSSNLVLGVEGNIDIPFDDETFGDYLASIRGRIGFAAGDVLFYGTGGVAFADDVDETVTGWVAGLGLDYKIRPNLSIGVEGLYYAFEEDFDDIVVGGVPLGSGTVERDFWTIQARVTYHFNDDRSAPLK